MTAGALLSRPFISQSVLVKDDLFVAAFFMVLLAGCRQERLKDRLGAWRIGIAAGLFFATKYVALQTAPLVILVINAPFRAHWKWREWIIAVATAALIAGPWYLRNVFLTGNPLYPVPLNIAGVQIFKGLFFPSPSAQMHTAAGVWKVLTGGYQRIPAYLLCIAITGWLIALFADARAIKKDPMIRAAVLGPAMGMLTFIFVSHAPEIRYAYPSLLLLLISGALAISKIPGARFVKILIAAIFVLICAADGFVSINFVTGALAAGIGLSIVGWIVSRLPRRAALIFGCTCCTGAGMWIFVYWQSIILTEQDNEPAWFEQAYPDLRMVWDAAPEASPPGSTIAYTNLALVRPMMGFDYSRNLIYVPTRTGVKWAHDLPANNVHLAEPEFRAFVEKLLSEDSDPQMWLKNLLASGADTLVIGKQPYMENPPELGLAADQPEYFQLVFENATGIVYRIVPNRLAQAMH